MSPQEALELVDRVISNVSGSRQDHISLQVAISVLRSLVTEDQSMEPVTETDPE